MKGMCDRGLWRLPIDRYIVGDAWVGKNSLDMGARKMIETVES